MQQPSSAIPGYIYPHNLGTQEMLALYRGMGYLNHPGFLFNPRGVGVMPLTPPTTSPQSPHASPPRIRTSEPSKSFTIDSILGTSKDSSEEKAPEPRPESAWRGSGNGVGTPDMVRGEHMAYQRFVCGPGAGYSHPPTPQHHPSPLDLAKDKKSSGSPREWKNGKNKRVRTIFTTAQLEQLEAEFARQQYMVGNERFALANHLQLSEAQVKVWFQNRRIKWRKTNHDQQAVTAVMFHKRLEEDDEDGIAADTSSDFDAGVSRESSSASPVVASRDQNANLNACPNQEGLNGPISEYEKAEANEGMHVPVASIVGVPRPAEHEESLDRGYYSYSSAHDGQQTQNGGQHGGQNGGKNGGHNGGQNGGHNGGQNGGHTESPRAHSSVLNNAELGEIHVDRD